MPESISESFNIYIIFFFFSWCSKLSFHSLKNSTDIDGYVDWIRKQKGLVFSTGFFLKRNKRLTLKAIQTSSAAKNSNLKYVFMDVTHFLSVNRFWKEDYKITKARFSTGFYFVSNALTLCDEVHLYGFWPFNTSLEGRTLHYHYHDQIVPSTVHNMTVEFRILIAMHQVGLLRLHVGKCTENPTTT